MIARMAKIVPTQLEKHGHIRVDNYDWMRNRKDPEVVAYLEAENEHRRRELRHLEPLADALYEEIKGRMAASESSVPYRRGETRASS